MKIEELIKILSGMAPERDVILQRDPEGNGYSPIKGADDEAVYTDDFDVYATDWSASDACMSEKEWEIFKKKNKKCVVLHPMD